MRMYLPKLALSALCLLALPMAGQSDSTTETAADHDGINDVSGAICENALTMPSTDSNSALEVEQPVQMKKCKNVCCEEVCGTECCKFDKEGGCLRECEKCHNECSCC